MKTQLKIQMLGSSFSIQSDLPREHIDDVLFYLNQQVNEVLEKNAGIEPVKIALLAALNLADELVRLKKNVAASKSGAPPADEIEKITGQLIQRIDDALTRQNRSSPDVG